MYLHTDSTVVVYKFDFSCIIMADNDIQVYHYGDNCINFINMSNKNRHHIID